MEELLKYLEQDRALGHSAYLFHAEKPEDIMEQTENRWSPSVSTCAEFMTTG